MARQGGKSRWAMVLWSAVLGVLALLAGLVQGDVARVGEDQAADRPDRELVVRIPEAHQDQIADWPHFFACYGLVQDTSVIRATLRANGEFMRGADIRIILEPDLDLSASKAEEDVIRAAKALSDQVGGEPPCPR